MSETPPLSRTADDTARWSVAAILSYGTLGGDTPEGRRYHIRSGMALAIGVVLALLGIPLGRLLPPTVRAVLAGALPGALFLYIVVEFRRYLLALDELARGMHYEALAWTYCTGLVLAMAAGGGAMALDWNVNPFWFMLLEPVRAIFLYRIARRY